MNLRASWRVRGALALAALGLGCVRAPHRSPSEPGGAFSSAPAPAHAPRESEGPSAPPADTEQDPATARPERIPPPTAAPGSPPPLVPEDDDDLRPIPKPPSFPSRGRPPH